MCNFEIAMKEVSIIIPVYNREKVVLRTLESVVAQSYRPLQVVLVDNASSDGTRVVLEQFRIDNDAPDFQVTVLEEAHPTAGAARNTGFAHATGSWVMFFDSDDVMKPRLVERYMGIVEQEPGELDMVFTRRRMVGEHGEETLCKLYKSDHIANHLLHSSLATQAYCVRREFFAQSDGWDIDLPAWNDYELGLRLLLLEPRMAWHDGRPLVDVMSSGEASITGRGFLAKANQWEHVMHVMAEVVKEAALDKKERRRYLDLLAYRMLVLAAHYQREGDAELAKKRCREAMTRLNRKWSYRKTMPWLFRRLVKGKGAGAIARLVIR